MNVTFTVYNNYAKTKYLLKHGAGQMGAAVWAPPIGRSPFGRLDIWAPGQMGAAVWALDVSALDNKARQCSRLRFSRPTCDKQSHFHTNPAH